jgi:hypothetical protein
LISAAASVKPVLTKITVSPAGASVDCYAAQQFTAVGLDQFGSPLATQPTFTWKVSAGEITSAGLFTPSARVGSVTITAASGSIRGSTVASVFDCPPTVATEPSVTLNPATGKTAALSVLGACDGGEAKLRYTWAVTTHPKGAPAAKFSANGSNAAKNSTVTFGAAGSYVLDVTITDVLGFSTTNSVPVVVRPMVAKIAVHPATATVESLGIQRFIARCSDQFGKSFVPPAGVVWSATGGGITPAGVFTAPGPSCKVTVTAACGPVVGSTSVTVVNHKPGIAKAASASPAAVTTGTTTTLSVLGKDDAGEANLTYTWTTAALPSGARAPVFSPNGTNAAKNTTLTFHTIGSYSFTATITDAGGLSVTSGVVKVTVSPAFTSISVSPAAVRVDFYSTQPFSAMARDQFGSPMAAQPTFSWMPPSAGKITPTGPSTGLFTPATRLGNVTITAACGSIRGTATATVFDDAPTVATPAYATPSPVTGTTTGLSVLGADDGGEPNLTYAWTTTKLPTGAPAPKFSASGSNAAKNTTVTFRALGLYSFTATITDAWGLSVTSTAQVTVAQGLTSISVSPTTVNVDLYTTQQFTAVGRDQFGSLMAVPPGFAWTASSGTMSPSPSTGPSTFYPQTPGSVTITAASGSIQGTATASVFDAAPTVVTPAYAAPNPVTGTTTTLAVVATGDGDKPNLTYTWSASVPSGVPDPAFSPNGTSAAANTTVTLRGLGLYSFTVTITDAWGQSVTSTAQVTVVQGLTSITVSPATAVVIGLSTQQYAAVGYDQFGGTMSPEPTFTWTVTAGTNAAAGTIAGGLFTAPASPGTVIISAESGYVQGTAQATVTPFLNLQDPSLRTLTSSLFARDGQINRADMIQILESVVAEGSVVSTADFSDLQTIVSNASALRMPGYVEALASDIVDGNPANAHYQGQALGNLYAGDAASNLTELVDKWFLGMDHPATSYTYQTCAGSLFGTGGPQYTDMQQGLLGDCYFVSALGSIATGNPAAIKNMFVDNGVTGKTGLHSWTVRFYTHDSANDTYTPDYVTVDSMLPVLSDNGWIILAYSGMGDFPTDPNNVLWIALAEKAYAQWCDTGYASMGNGGTPDVVDAAVLGRGTPIYSNAGTVWLGGLTESILINAMQTNQAVSAAIVSPQDTNLGLVGDHYYSVAAYDGTSGLFTLCNPFGPKYGYSPGTTFECFLTWDEVNVDVAGFAVADPWPTPPVISSPAPAADASHVSLQIVPALGSPSIAASKQFVGWDKPGAVPPRLQAIHGGTALRLSHPTTSKPGGAESRAALAWFTSPGSDWQWPGSDRSGVSPQPSSELTPALVDSVLRLAASRHGGYLS